MSNTYSKQYNSIFLKKYKELETLQSNEPSKYNYLFNKHRQEIDTFRYIRNTLSHNLINGDDPFIVAKEVVDLISTYLDDVKKKVFNFAVKKDRMQLLHYTDTLKDALEIMGNNNLSYIPLVDIDLKVVGIVTSDAIIDIFNKKDKLKVEENDKLLKYNSYFDLNNTENGFYLFVNKDIHLFELEEKIDKYHYSTSKLHIILITENGKINESILGLLTPWDIIKNI